MKILNISAQKPDSTGSGIYLAETVRCQAAAGHEAAVIAGIGPDDAPAFDEGVQFFPVRFETPELPFCVAGMSDRMPYPSTRYRDMTPPMVEAFTRAFASKVTQVDAAFQPDVVLCHHLYLVTSVVREQLSGRRVCAICHSTDLRQMESHGLERERIVAAIRELDAVFALHDVQKQQIVDVYGIDPARVHVVGTGFNAAIFNKGDEMPAGPQPRAALELVYAGKIWRKKGVESLIAALDSMDADTFGGALVPAPGAPLVRLRCAGGYSDQAEYEGIVAKAQACAQPVEFLGKLAQTDLAEAYRFADVFVLPSFFEGLPLVAVEALACGCTVVMTDLPGIRPWFEACAPGAPIVYVEPPRMVGVDEPLADDLPAFEARLADALREAALAPKKPADVGHLSWEGLTGRIVAELARL